MSESINWDDPEFLKFVEQKIDAQYANLKIQLDPPNLSELNAPMREFVINTAKLLIAKRTRIYTYLNYVHPNSMLRTRLTQLAARIALEWCEMPKPA